MKEQLKKEEIYLDLSKCTEEEQKHIFSLLPKPTYEIQYAIDSNNYMLDFDDGEFWVNDTLPLDGKQELTYPEFIKLFEGGDGENNGWVKIESEADLPKDEKFWICTSDGRVLISSKAVLNWILKNENNKVTHYQPIQKPEPPKL